MSDGYLNFDTKINTSGFTSALKKLAGALAIGATVKSAVNAGMSFESAFAGVKKTVDATTEQLAGLKQGIRDMAKELPTSANEIAGVAEAAGQLGIETDNILGFTKTMTMLGDATNLTAEQAATTLARFANITGMSQDNFDRLGSSIVALGNNFATTEAEIADMGQNIASAGSQVGMSEPEIMGFAAALSSVGMEAAAGGTAISKLIKDMQLAVETGSEDLQEFANVAGVSADEFSKAFRDNAAEAVTDFFMGLNDTERLGKSAIAVLDDMGISEVRLSDAILRAAGSGDLFKKALETSTKAWEDNTALTKEAEQRYETLESKLGILKNHFIDLGISFYDSIQEPLKRAVSSAIDSLASLTKSIQNGSLKEAVAGIGEAFGTIVTTVGNVVSTVLPPLISALGKIGPVMSTTAPAILSCAAAFKAFNGVSGIIGGISNAVGTLTSGIGKTAMTASSAVKAFGMLSNPLGLLIAGTTGAAVGGLMLVDALSKGSEETQRFNQMLHDVSMTNNELTDSLEKSKQASTDKINANEAEMYYLESLNSELSTLVDSNGYVQEKDRARVEFILGELNNALGTEYQMLDGIVQKNGEIGSAIDQLIEKKRMQNQLSALEDTYTVAVENQKTAYENLKNVLSEMAVPMQTYNGLTEEQKKLYNDASIAAENAGYSVDAYMTNMKASNEEYRSFDEKTITALGDLDKLKRAYNDASSVLEESTDTINSYKNATKAMAEGNTEAFDSYIDSMTGDLMTGKEATKEFGTEAQKHLLDLQDKMVDSLGNLKEAMRNYSETGSEDALLYLNNALAEFESAKGEFEAAGGKIVNGVSTGVEGEEIDLNPLLDDIASYNSSFQAKGIDLADGLAEGIRNGTANVCSAARQLVSDALVAMADEADSHSPSRRARDEIGAMISAGVAIGIEENSEEVEKAAREMMDVLDTQRDLAIISEAEYYKKIEEYRDAHFDKSTKLWAEYTKKLMDYDEKLRDRQFKNLDWFHDNSIISDSMYYQMLADLRDQYFSESDEEWQDYTEKILNHQMDLINDTKDNLKNALDEAQKAYDDAVADGAEKMREYSPSLLKIKSDDGNGNVTEYYRPNDYSYRKYSDEYYNSMMNMQGLIGLLEPGSEEYKAGLKIYAELAAEDQQEAVKQIQTYLNMSLDDFKNHIKQTAKIWKEDDDRGEDVFGFIPGLELEKAEDEMKQWEQFQKEWFEAFGTLPDKSYNIGVEMMQSIINGALSQIENFQSKVVEGMLSTFSGASIGINSISGSPATASAGGGDTYIINSPGSTIGESIRALKNQATINRLRGY